MEAGVTEYSSFCVRCGTYLYPQNILEYLKHELGEATEQLLTLCPRCRRYDLGEKLKAQLPGKRKVSSSEVEMRDGR
jgi:ribosomal protein S27AE